MFSEMSGQTLGVLITAAVSAAMLVVVIIKANLVICEPNEVVVISGRSRKLGDGQKVGYRIIRGGRGFKLPIVESVNRLSLSNLPIEISIHNALARGIIPVNVTGRANVKIDGSETEGLPHSIERFIGKNATEIAQVAKEIIEGSMRGVLAGVTPEEANARRLELADEVADQARRDLKRLGLKLDFLRIQNISDDQGYLEAIGRKKNAEVMKDASVAEATAEADARIVASEQKRKASVAETEANLVIANAENKLKVHEANLAAKSNRAQEIAKVAGEIARTTEQKRLETSRVALNKSKYQADVVVPAEAERAAAELRASGGAAKILEDGKATAAAVRLMKEQWEDPETRDLFIIQMLPELLDKVTSVIADNLHIDKLTVLDSGDGNGVPTHVRNLTGSAITLFEQLKNATGIDVSGLLSGGGQKSNGTELPKALA